MGKVKVVDMNKSRYNLEYGKFIASLTERGLEFFNDIDPKIHKSDVILFTGGEDVTPSFYDAIEHKTTYYNTTRDNYEMEIFKKIPLGVLKVGICRGSQFLTVMSGGLLIQNVINHAIGDTHDIELKENGEYLKKLPITSTHHQMMYPFNLPEQDYEIIAKAATKRSNGYYDGDKIDPEKVVVEPEIVYYKKTNCLCVQGHPEMMYEKSETVKKIIELINYYSK